MRHPLRSLFKFGCALAACVLPPDPSSNALAKSAAKPDPARNLQKIFESYSFVGDFSLKEETRPISGEIFWRYPFVPPKADLPIIYESEDIQRDIPSTVGDGRAVDHLNRGRLLFLEKKYAEAKNTWLSARARYGKDYPFHRRTDYFIGSAFLSIAAELIQKDQLPLESVEVRSALSNAATFFSWAFIVKADQSDELVDRLAPKGLYNLAAIYWQYERYAGAYGAADSGLNFLRKTGRKDFRGKFNRILAESYIRNRTYLEAIQTLDQSIRQDPVPEDAALSFGRAGDIYFDLNNYELADDAYAFASKIQEHLNQIDPAHLILQGESLFWLGKFSESQKMLYFALHGQNFRKEINKMPDDFIPWASLRIADAYLARHETDKARLEYYKVGHQFRSHPAGRLAKIREACLELPFYGGHNIQHARELLESAKESPETPNLAREIAWSCQVASYTKKERTPEMLQRVKDFATAYPESLFLKTFFEPVRAYQATQIDALFRAPDPYGAIAFFEKNRTLLYPQVDEKLAQKLFAAYADTSHAKEAAEFWGAYQKEPDTDLKVLRSVTVAAEMLQARSQDPLWRKRTVDYAKALRSRTWTTQPHALLENYVTRLRQSGSAASHNSWLLSLIQKWARVRPSLQCDAEYPILAQLFEAGGQDRERAASGVRSLIQKNLPAILSTDESCGLSLLDFEAKLYEQDLPGLADLYLKRRDWPMSDSYRHRFWTLSEELHEQGHRVLARAMWAYLVQKAPPQSEEVAFAKSRLDPTTTELERLWK